MSTAPGPDDPDGRQGDERTTPEPGTGEWYAALAERAVESALDSIRSGEDAAPALSLAATAWDVVMGHATEDQRADMDEYLLADDGGYVLHDSVRCTCPPDVVARGGYASGCPVHHA